VDKTRTNEFGQSFESEGKEKEQETLKKTGKQKERSGRTKRKRRIRLDGEVETCDNKTLKDGDKEDDADNTEWAALDSDSNGDEVKLSDSGDDTVENDKSGTATEEGDSDTEEEKDESKGDGVETKELISGNTSAEARVGVEGPIPCSGSDFSEKLKAD